jgi:glycosyltransferase involved in cell wall biosynthesis
MKILQVHNFYQQPGGEDVVFSQERGLLESKGHEVITYTRSNHEAQAGSLLDRARMLRSIVSSDESRRQVTDLLRARKPDLVHIHNTFMMISPSIYDACAALGVPTVLTLHNYRMLCPSTTLYRNGEVCEECIDGGLARGVMHGCYRESRLTTAAVAMMIQIHRSSKTWDRHVGAFIALTEFAKQKFIDNGLPSAKIHVKPNFVAPDPGERERAGDYALFVGRLSPEKGVAVLLEAWGKLGVPVPLKIVGDGPSRAELQSQAERLGLPRVEFLGRLEAAAARETIKRAGFLVIPSLWYEGFPLVIAESFACGVPVVGSRLGSMEEIIRDGGDGVHFTAGDADDLAEKVRWAWTHPAEMEEFGRSARRKFEAHYSPQANYEALMDIYGKAASA